MLVNSKSIFDNSNLLKLFHLMAMFLIAGNFVSNTLIFLWLQQEKIPSVIKHKLPLFCHALVKTFFTYRQQEDNIFHDSLNELKKISFECEFDNLQDSQIKDVTVYGTRDTSLFKRILQECDRIPSKAIGEGYAAQEIYKHAREILGFQPTTDTDKTFFKKLSDSIHSIRNHNRRDFRKKCNFCDSSHLQGKFPAYEKVCHLCNKKIHFKVCW